MSDSLAPVILFTYNRPDHTQQVLNALADNYLAKESELFIFCDGPKNENTIKNNDLVKSIIRAEENKGRFKTVTVIESEINKGLARSIISGVSEIIHRYGKCIVLEDDHITSKYFLTYQNEALVYYKDDKRIWSISGFTYALKPLNDYPHDIYLSYRACSHGWGTWEDRWVLVDWDVKDFKKLSRSPMKIARFNRGGNDLYRMLRHQVRGERDSWAIRFCYSQSVHDMLTVYPKVSLIKNIGFDGTGTHCQNNGNALSSVFDSDIKSIRLEHIELDNRIIVDFKSQYRVSFGDAVETVRNKLKKLIGEK